MPNPGDSDIAHPQSHHQLQVRSIHAQLTVSVRQGTTFTEALSKMAGAEEN
jgi:hypothetical protein